MNRIIVVSAIAGSIVGIVFFIFGAIFVRIGIIEPPVSLEIWRELYGLVILASISLGVIWGVIFGAIYSILYNSIPGKGVLKGLCYGILIWLIKDIAAGSYIALIGIGTNYALALILVGFFMWIVYGFILGYFYKK